MVERSWLRTKAGGWVSEVVGGRSQAPKGVFFFFSLRSVSVASGEELRVFVAPSSAFSVASVG